MTFGLKHNSDEFLSHQLVEIKCFLHFIWLDSFILFADDQIPPTWAVCDRNVVLELWWLKRDR